MLILTALTLFAQIQPTTPAATINEKSMQLQSVQALSSMMEGRSTMIIDPKARADDYVKAFDFLRQEKSVSKIFFNIRGGMKISNVIEIKSMPGNTLIMFRYNSPQGIKFQVVGIEDILGIEHS